MVVGITGTSGSGKSTVSRIFAENGFTHIDLDAVYRSVTVPFSPCLKEIESVFGPSAILPDGNLNRAELAKTVFSNKEKLNLLNSVTHKFVIEKMKEIISRTKGDILLDVPLLFESGVDRMCDFTVGVIADRELKIERIIARDGVDEDIAKARLDSQKSDDFYIQNCDFTIENNQNHENLISRVESLILNIRKAAENV